MNVFQIQRAAAEANRLNYEANRRLIDDHRQRMEERELSPDAQVCLLQGRLIAVRERLERIEQRQALPAASVPEERPERILMGMMLGALAVTFPVSLALFTMGWRP